MLDSAAYSESLILPDFGHQTSGYKTNFLSAKLAHNSHVPQAVFLYYVKSSELPLLLAECKTSQNNSLQNSNQWTHTVTLYIIVTVNNTHTDSPVFPVPINDFE